MATIKSAMTTNVPAPKNQGNMGSSAAVTQNVKIQPKLGPDATGKSTILYSKQPSGTKGSGKGAN
jgi:hypothetical protein